MPITRRSGDTLAVWNEDKGAWDYRHSPEIDPAEGMSALEAGLVSAGGRAKDIPATLASGSLGLMEAAGLELPPDLQNLQQGYQEQLAGTEQMLEPVAGQQAAGSLVGDILGSAPVGGPISQGAIGAMYGAAEPEPMLLAQGLEKLGMAPDSPVIRGINAAQMAAMSILGDRSGKAASRMAGRMKNRMRAGEALRNQQRSLDVLTRQDVPLTKGQRTQDPRILAQERARSTAAGGEVLQGEQKQRLAEIGSEALGLAPDNQLSPEVLGKAADEIGAKFDKVSGLTNLSRPGADDLARITARAEAQTVDPNLVTRQVNRVAELPDSISGQQYLQIRSDISKVTEQLYRKGDYVEAEVLDELVDVLDDAVQPGVPKALQAELTDARKQWKLLKTMEMGRAIGQTDELNPISLQSAARRKYGAGLRRGRYPDGPTGEFLRTIDAYNRTAVPYRSSGTAERLAPYLYGTGGGSVKKAARAAGRLADEALQPLPGAGGAAGRQEGG